MAFYIFLCVLLGVFSLLENNTVRFTVGGKGRLDRTAGAIGMLFLFMLAFFRAETVGGDLVNYKLFFQVWKTQSFSLSSLVRQWDPLFYLINWVIGQVTDNFQVVLMVTATLTYVLYYKAILLNSKNVCMSLFLFICLGRIRGSYSGIRQELAVAIVFYSFKFIKEKKMWNFVLCVIIATAIHKTALVAILAYWVVNAKHEKHFWLKLLVLMTGIVISIIFFVPFIVSLYQTNDYSNRIIAGEGIPLALLEFTIYVFIHEIRKSKNNQDDIDTIMLQIFGLCCLFQISAFGFSLLNRLTYYFQPSLIILIPNTLEEISDNKRRRYWQLLVIVIGTIYFIYETNPNSSGIIPYRFMWSL